MPYGGMWDMNYNSLGIHTCENVKMVPKKMYNSFGNYWYDGDTCPDCSVWLSHDNTDYNAGRNGVTANGRLAGQQKKVRHCNVDYLKNMKERQDRLKKSRLLNTAPAHEVLEFMFPETKESMVTQRTVNHKTRNKPLYTMLKELYNYTCQVEGCNETEVEVAHIYKHSLPDSVDNETNTWCLCRNHHRAYDANRMIFNPALNGRFIRYNVFGKVYEIGRIIYDDKHTIDIKWIKKAREWHDRKK